MSIATLHSSDDTHRRVIAHICDRAGHRPCLELLQELAHLPRAVPLAHDFGLSGMITDWDGGVQRRLHKDLVCAEFEPVIAVGLAQVALGYKVNGPGGDVGPLAILGDGDAVAKRKTETALPEEGFIPVPIYLSRFGVRVWE